VLASETGRPREVLETASEIIEARYEVPFLAHGTMEPMNCTAHASGESCEIWAPTQNPAASRSAAAEALGIPVESVRVHTTLLGGGFGRRNETDFVVQAALISRAVARPVKLIWSREEDIRHDTFRPAYACLLRTATDPAGLPIAWSQRVAGPSFTARNAPPWLRKSVAWLQCSLGSGLVPDATPNAIKYRFPPWVYSGADGLAVGGAGPGAYRVPHHRVEYSLVDTSVPVGWWRSVGHSQNAFFTEGFTDELAHRAGRDPYEYRRALLANAPREREVLDRAARASGWGTALPAGSGRGIAFSSGFGSHVCEVAEVSQAADGKLRVDRVVCVIDCGQIVNPDTIRAQMEGSIVFGLSAALHEKVTLRAGAVEQTNINDYRLLGLAECPEIEVHIVDSHAPPGGVGEPGTPPIAPAVANAVFAATGRRIRRLPLGERVGG
jgi:CO/xanthine dehydrogenase Mo-binding subunit